MDFKKSVELYILEKLHFNHHFALPEKDVSFKNVTLLFWFEEFILTNRGSKLFGTFPLVPLVSMKTIFFRTLARKFGMVYFGLDGSGLGYFHAIILCVNFWASLYKKISDHIPPMPFFASLAREQAIFHYQIPTTPSPP